MMGEKRHEFLVLIDSDGCVFDTMEIKHKECFIPTTIEKWGLQAVSKYVREAHEFVNLYSRWRGINRFPALVRTFDLLRERPEVKRRGIRLPDLGPLREWAKREKKLGNPALKAEVERTGDPTLKKVLEWSIAVNESIERMVRGVPPFPYAREFLEMASKEVDIVVVSATPAEALRREWTEHGIEKYAMEILGQEVGTKEEQMKMFVGEYPVGNALMIGDALGDLEAADSSGTLFYPIIPKKEEECWKRLCEKYFGDFIAHSYAGYQQPLIEDFKKSLPESPPWGT